MVKTRQLESSIIFILTFIAQSEKSVQNKLDSSRQYIIAYKDVQCQSQYVNMVYAVRLISDNDTAYANKDINQWFRTVRCETSVLNIPGLIFNHCVKREDNPGFH